MDELTTAVDPPGCLQHQGRILGGLRTLFRTPCAIAMQGMRKVSRAGVALGLLAQPAIGAEFGLEAQIDWVTNGEIYQVWLHREFDGRLLQTGPVRIDTDSEIQSLFEDLTLECRAHASIGLPDWSVTTGTCVLTNAAGDFAIEIDECSGTRSRCEGHTGVSLRPRGKWQE